MVSVAVLLFRSLSVIYIGGVTVAVFTNGWLIVGETVPWIVNVALPPFSRLSVVCILFPAPLYAPQTDPGEATAVQVTPVMSAGTVSVKTAPVEYSRRRSLGPLLVATTVYVMGSPGATLVWPSVLVTSRSAGIATEMLRIS